VPACPESAGRRRARMRAAILEALCVSIHADNAGALIEGSLPTIDPGFAPGEAVSDVCTVVSMSL